MSAAGLPTLVNWTGPVYDTWSFHAAWVFHRMASGCPKGTSVSEHSERADNEQQASDYPALGAIAYGYKHTYDLRGLGRVLA